MNTVQEIVEGVWHVVGAAPGPIVAIVGGTHGNERTGIEIVERLRRLFETGALALLRGELFLVLGNPKAIAKRERGSEVGADLNRKLTQLVLEGHGASYEEQRARELATALASVQIGLDVHATNKPSVPFIMSQRELTAQARALCRCLGAKIVVTDPRWIFAGGPVTLDEFFGRNGGIGLCYETGLAEDTSRVDEIEVAILNVLGLLDLITAQTVTERITAPTCYELTAAITLDARGFTYADGVGTHNFQPICAGQLIGRHGADALVAAEDGVLVFPKISSLWQLGQPVGYLAAKR